MWVLFTIGGGYLLVDSSVVDWFLAGMAQHDKPKIFATHKTK